MVHDLTCLSPIESEMESKTCGESHDTGIHHQVRHVSMTMSIERIVTEFITIGLVMSVWFVNDQVGMGVGRENVLVTIQNKLEMVLSVLTGT